MDDKRSTAASSRQEKSKTIVRLGQELSVVEALFFKRGGRELAGRAKKNMEHVV